jgi:hypothetical protein
MDVRTKLAAARRISRMAIGTPVDAGGRCAGVLGIREDLL